MSEAASRLTVKVKLHPAPLPPESDTPVLQPAPWSKTRIALASLVLVGAGVAGYQFLLRPAAPARPVVVTEPVKATQQSNTVVRSSSQSDTAQVSSEVAKPVVEKLPETVDQTPPQTQSVALPETAVSAKPAVTAVQPVVEEKTTAPSNIQQLEPSSGSIAAAAADSEVVDRLVLPTGFSRIVLTDQMNNLQPGKAVGQQIPYPRINRLYLFTELKGYAGQIVKHRWYFRDTLHTEAVLTIEDSPWRTYSENWLLDDQQGPWRVEIVDQTQKVIFQYSFTYQ